MKLIRLNLSFHIKLVLIAIFSSLAGTESVLGDDWPQWGGPQRDCVWREKGIVRELPKGELLPRVWSTPIGEGYSGPAVAGSRLFITDFTDRNMSRGQERVLCLDAVTGKVIWTHAYPVRYDISYPAGPRATPVVDGERVYTIGATGKMFCFNVADGEILWQKDFVEDYNTRLPTWGMASAPLVDGDRLITLVGGEGESTVICFNKETGEEAWRALDDPQVGYAPPMMYQFGDVRQLIMWHPEAVSSLDPTSGKTLWSVPFRVQAGLCIPTPQKLGNQLFLTSFYNGSRMIDVAPDASKATIAWQGKSDSEIRTDGLHSIMSTPIVTESHIYGVCSYGQLRCLDTKTGRRIWETEEATGAGRWWNAFLIPHEDRVFIHNEQGDLIIAELSPEGYKEISRSKLVEPTRKVMRRMTIWSHPAFAHQSVFARNDKEIVRVNLAAD